MGTERRGWELQKGGSLLLAASAVLEELTFTVKPQDK